jgi:ring-1,2-phenylacetyl-CoA epoxidase subunit PaaD
MVSGDVVRTAKARQIAESVPDPELPMLTLADLGVLREVRLEDDRVVVSLTPTYSGCPAMLEMRKDIAARLAAAGFGAVEVRTVLSPAWSADFISAEGRRKLAEAGIAPPQSGRRQAGGVEPARPSPPGAGPVPLTLFARDPAVDCPLCGSADTKRVAAFSSTACKDLYRCLACAEPFEHVKEI